MQSYKKKLKYALPEWINRMCKVEEMLRKVKISELTIQKIVQKLQYFDQKGETTCIYRIFLVTLHDGIRSKEQGTKTIITKYGNKRIR